MQIILQDYYFKNSSFSSFFTFLPHFEQDMARLRQKYMTVTIVPKINFSFNVPQYSHEETFNQKCHSLFFKEAGRF